MTDPQHPEQSCYSRAVVVFFEQAASSQYIDAQMHHFAELSHVKLVTDLRACRPLDEEFVRSVLHKQKRVKVGQGALL